MSDWAMNTAGHAPGRSAPSAVGGTDTQDDHVNTISPLPGEPGIPDVSVRRYRALSGKGLMTVGLLMVSLIGVSAFSIEKFTGSGKKPDDGGPKRVSDRPAAATTEPRKLEMLTLTSSAAAVAAKLAPVALTDESPAMLRLRDLVQPPDGMTAVDLPDGRRVFAPAGVDPHAVREHLIGEGAET